VQQTLGIAVLDPTYHENTGDCVGWVEQRDTQQLYETPQQRTNAKTGSEDPVKTPKGEIS